MYKIIEVNFEICIGDVKIMRPHITFTSPRTTRVFSITLGLDTNFEISFIKTRHQ